MMKYEPTNSNNQNSELQWLMMPFADAPAETDWELIDIVTETVATLSEADQKALHGIFYERKTYQDLASDLDIKAKSHAWRRTETALKNLKTALTENEAFREIIGERYGEL
jgi:DNA-directed RNA polymerase specialized sigma subunit